MDRRGFTLLEMIVVVAVMGFLMIGLTEGTRFGLRAWKHQGDMIAERDQFDAVDRTLRLLLTQIEMRAADQPDALSFTGTLPAAVALGTRRADMDLLVDQNRQLILRWVPHRHETPLGEPEKPVTTVLLRNVGRLTIAYWQSGDPNAADDQSTWVDQLDAGTVPKLIKLTLEFPPGDRRRWPPIVVAPGAIGPEDETQPGQAAQ
jgi:general secretion pathway protein J